MSASEIPEKPNNRAPLLSLSEGLLLASVPAAGFGVALSFEAGYLSRFGIPAWTIALGTAQVVISAYLVFGSFLLIVNLLPFLPAGSWRPLVVMGTRAGAFLWVGWRFIRITEWTWGSHLYIAIPLIVFTFGLGMAMLLDDLILPIWRKTGDSVWERWEHELHEHRRKQPVKDSLSDRLWQRLGPGAADAFAVSAAVGFIAYSAGERRATRQYDFQYVAAHDCLAIRKYSETILCVDADTVAQRTRLAFRLLPVPDSGLSVSTLRLEKLETVADSLDREKVFRPRQ